MPGTSSDAVAPTVTVARERFGMRSLKMSRDRVSLPPFAGSLLTVRRRTSPAGTFTSKVRRRRKSLAFARLEGDGTLEARLRLCAGLDLVLARDGVGAGGAFHIVQGQFQPRLVSEREEARGGDRQRHGIAHDHV